MESAADGRTQLMYARGQLSEKYNLFWDQEFIGFQGLRSMNDIKRLSLDNVCCQRLDKTQLDHYYSLLQYVCPIVNDEICFQLLSMVMMFDTSNLIEDDITKLDIDETSRFSSLKSLEFDKTTRQCSQDMNSKTRFTVINDANDTNNSSNDIAYKVKSERKKANLQKGFDEIRGLQNRYIYLLHRYCMGLEDPRLRKLGDTDSLRGTIDGLKQLSQPIPLLM